MTMLPPPSAKKLGLVIDLDTCVGCHACVVACKGWNTASPNGAPLSDQNAYSGAGTGTWLNRVHAFEVQPEAEPTTERIAIPDGTSSAVAPGAAIAAKGADVVASVRLADSAIAQPAAQIVHFPKSCLHCEEAPCVTVCPTGASFKRAEDGIVLVNESTCIGCGLCAWACPYGAREKDAAEGVMKKCTLCVDRIDNETLAPEDRVPACVRTCPAGARHFGDLGDPNSAVSILVAERGGMDLMPEQGTKPVNKYLPPRPRDQAMQRAWNGEAFDITDLADETAEAPGGFLGWLDRALDRMPQPTAVHAPEKQ